MQWPRVREMILFFGGIAGIAHEAGFEDGERLGIIFAFISMMGIPFVTDLDRFRRENRETPSQEKEEV